MRQDRIEADSQVKVKNTALLLDLQTTKPNWKETKLTGRTHSQRNEGEHDKEQSEVQTSNTYKGKGEKRQQVATQQNII